MATYYKTMDSPIGVLMLGSDEWQLKSISFEAEYLDNESYIPGILITAEKQLEEYFSGSRQIFELPIDPEGTEFQKNVWKKVAGVSFGTTKSYVEIAREVNSENSSRAVGMANGKNPLPIIIPCHRIIGHNGKLTGYAGGLERKKWLLLHEQKHSVINRLF
ncbi:MAG TPA: methylated-DNA--[protein]-cysteine S-methyltransferase [Prolixibacteraceae bacterium]|nr:methylated-DNA--[protein]-cysteine S-methyltransferase [Prolixibacteraceae bacterium]